ncbi:MAG: nuclear transport factor 2 family protein [Acidimicrobiia bacterium]
MTPTPASGALEVALASPVAVAAHDKDAWMALFARDHVVEDPVGGRPVVGGRFDPAGGDRGDGPLSRFWDTFIAPNDITVSGAGDVVDGSTVARHVTIETRTPTGVVLRTPAHLVYELTDEDGSLRIRRLAAHWEVGPMLRQLLRPSWAHVRSLLEQGTRSLRLQGPAGTIAFVRSIRSVGEHGKAEVARLVAAAHAGDEQARALLGGVAPTDLGGLIAAGPCVSGTCTADGTAALLVCELDRKTRRVTGSTLYVDRR